MASPRKLNPETTSSPAIPDAPSFLTTLPPEIRNHVYEVLFKRDEPVLVHNKDAYHAKEPERDKWMSTDDYMVDIRRFEKIYEEEMDSADEFRQVFHLELPLLLTCRQIYHESSGVFYGCNVFMLSRALNRHDSDNDESHDEEVYGQLDYAPKWVSKLGSQVAFLRTVAIDIFGGEVAGDLLWGAVGLLLLLILPADVGSQLGEVTADGGAPQPILLKLKCLYHGRRQEIAVTRYSAFGGGEAALAVVRGS
ncbi:hypothetical protein EK21DRAFT_111838 [Setomelanomma holmii]|uniref:DUF7730 domain-containing protein n=1 Tax=Setomelanomma holmii TaxID=210430 RepID=A0A9P4LMS5_9PLEO|nr:hypothetical protein EK21DRAFT_111838 [Setomelanomma holmii]